MNARGAIALVIIVIAGCYEAPPPGEPCAITCTDVCPGDELSCVNGFCVTEGQVCAPALQRVSAGAGYACALDEAGRLWRIIRSTRPIAR